MSFRDENHAQKHPGYDDALRQAAKLAAGGMECTVYWDGMRLYVRNAFAPKPLNAITICCAQKWDDKTVQLRFTGARSEWVKI